MFQTPTFEITAQVWLWNGKGIWYFVTLPGDISTEIRDNYKQIAVMGMIPVTVTLGTSQWKTSLFNTKGKIAYILPLKKAIRTKENIQLNQVLTVRIKPI